MANVALTSAGTPAKRTEFAATPDIPMEKVTPPAAVSVTRPNASSALTVIWMVPDPHSAVFTS